MHVSKPRIVAIACFVLLFPLTSWSAQDNKAYALMAQVFNQTLWRDFQGELALTLANRQGHKKVRHLQVYSKRSEENQTRMLMRFLNPADVRGTGLLVIEHKDSDDDRRLYLPSLRRVHRISASGAGGNFMASDFSYYDLGRPKLDDWHYQFSDETGEKNCRVVIGTAVNKEVQKNTGYSKVKWCVDKTRHVVLQADYYDASGDHFKHFTAIKIEKIDGGYFITHARMNGILTAHQSDMVFNNLKTNQDLADSLFTERFLRKWRR